MIKIIKIKIMTLKKMSTNKDLNKYGQCKTKIKMTFYKFINAGNIHTMIIQD